MNPKIIEKLNLTETDIQFGQTFKYGIKVYRLGDNLLLAACDTLGEPHPRNYILWFNEDYSKHGYFSEGFLLDLPITELNLMVNNTLKYESAKH